MKDAILSSALPSIRSHRRDLLRQYMLAHGLDAIALTSPDWFEWAGNHTIREQAWERPFLLVITRDGDSRAFLATQSSHQTELAAQRGTLWIDSIDFYAESPSLAASGWVTPQWPTMVAGGLNEMGLSKSRIGVDSTNGAISRVAEQLESVNFVPLDRDFRSLRWRKSVPELAVMRECAALSDWAIGIMREELRSGRMVVQADYAVSSRLMTEAARRVPGQDFSIVTLSTLAGPLSACPKGDRGMFADVLGTDTTAVTTIALKLDGLMIEQARTWLIGNPGADALRMTEVARRAQDAAIAAMIAGRKVAGIHAAAQGVFDSHDVGQHLRLRAGHGIGVVMHDFPEDMAFEERLLEADEVLVAEPSLFIPGLGGFRFADVAVVGTTEPERLTRAPVTNSDLTIN